MNLARPKIPIAAAQEEKCAVRVSKDYIYRNFRFLTHPVKHQQSG